MTNKERAEKLFGEFTDLGHLPDPKDVLNSFSQALNEAEKRGAAPFKVYGTDDCAKNDFWSKTCGGRVTLYYTDKLCFECQHKAMKVAVE